MTTNISILEIKISTCSTGPRIESLDLQEKTPYHVVLKAGFYRKALEVHFMSPFILTALLLIGLINGAYLRHVPLSGHHNVALFNDVVNDIESP